MLPTLRTLGLVLVCAASLSLGSCRSTCCASAASDAEGVARAKQSYFAAWTKQAGQAFDPATLTATVENSDDFLSFDGMSPTGTVIQGWKNFSGLWIPGMNQFRRASLSEAKPLRTWISGDLALTASIAHIQGETADGHELDMLGHLTLGYARRDGRWQIVHEHMSLNVKE